MSRTRCLILFLFGLGAMGWAGAAAKKDPPKKEPPKESIPLPATNSFYFLYVPEGVDPNEQVPLVILAQNAPDQAKQTFDSWVPKLKADQVFVACLHLPQEAADQMEVRVARMIDDIHKKYENLDARRMVLLGTGAGAQDVMKFVAGRPGYFPKAIALSPNGFPELPKKFVSAGGRTDLLVTLPKAVKGKEPAKTEKKDAKAEREAAAKEREAAKKTALCLQILNSRAHLTGKEDKDFGVGGASDKETALALETIRSCYSAAKRGQILAALKPPEGDKAGKDDKEDAKGKENPKTAKTTEEGKGQTPAKATETSKATPKEAVAETKSADELLEDANKLETEQKYTAALKVYERLAKVKPGSEYETLANKKKDELMRKPVVIQAMADEAAGPEPKRWLTAARSFEGADQPEKAAAECKKIVSKYPGTSYADEARKILERIEASNK